MEPTSEQLSEILAAVNGAPPELQDAYRMRMLYGRKFVPSTQAWIERFVKIEHKTTGLEVPFKLNRVQLHVQDWRERCYRDKRPARAVILKSRQHGVSTYFLAAGLEEALRHDLGTMFRGGIVGQADDTARELLENGKLMRDSLPWTLPVKFDNRQQLRFEQPVNAKIDILSAKTKGIGRGKHYRFLHMTETAFWPDPKETFNALAQTVPEDPGTTLTMETTANGAGGWFHDFFWRSRKGQTDFEAMFYPWMWDEQLRRPVTAEQYAEIMDTLDDEERHLIKKFGVDIEQLAWRRHAIVNKCGGDLDLFHQEYPSEPEEAFIRSGRPVFMKSLADAAKASTFDPVWVGDVIVDKEKTKLGRAEYRLVENPNGALKIWSHPKDGVAYCAGSDAAEGLGQDYSATSVLEVQSGCQVAEYASNTIKPSEFGYVSIAICQHFNACYWLPEINNPGNATMQVGLDVGYPRVMFTQVFGRAGQVIKQEYGWRTREDSKRLMVKEMEADLGGPNETIASEELAQQIAAYQVIDEGRVPSYSAPKGGHDDLLMGRGIGLMCRRLLFETQMEDDDKKKQAPMTESERHWQEFEASLKGDEDEEEEDWWS